MEFRTNCRRSSLFLAACLVAGLLAAPALARVQVGEVLRANIDTPRLYEGSPDGSTRLVWQHDLIQPGATYLALQFSEFELAPGDYLVVSDANGGQSYRLHGRGKQEAGSFWSQHVKGDTIRLELYSAAPGGGPGFDIVNVAVGTVDLGEPGGTTRAICGADDKDNAICYESTFPDEYAASRPVARLLISGAFLCTGWLASPDSYFVTNEHCITNATEALNTDYEFMSEAPTCGTGNCQLCHTGAIFSGASFVQDNAALDYSLVRIAGNPAATYGYLQIDDRNAIVGERIYIPQHPGGRAKELGIFSSASSDAADGMCHVNSITSPPCSGSGYNDVGYFCDTEGGSSGSPVIAASNHQVVALHHCANCPNRGVPIDLVYAEISQFLAQPCGVDVECDDGLFCNGAETCDGGSCAAGSDPCPGQDCDEAGDVCVPLVCNGNGVCDSGEDCNNCSSDCISGMTSGAVCGNDVCEIGAGEDCFSCPGDCNSKQNGNPSNRYCCGADAGCGDAVCTGNGNTCDSGGGSGTSYCCGDGTCEGDEDSNNCAIDCGPPPFCGDSVCSNGEDCFSCPADCPAASSETSCTNGVDDDCDGAVDCADSDCDTDPACDTSCAALGDACNVNDDCCSNKCKGPSGRKTCK